MGMSASQIRYCMLQARKNDVEYQGQQINQQRTTLATQSAAHNTELLTLTVPTPPSTEQYTTTNYTYVMNGTECTIKGLSYNGDGTYKIDYTTKIIKDVASKGSKFSYKYKEEKDADGKVTNVSRKVVLNGRTYDLTEVNENVKDDAEIHNVNIALIEDAFGTSSVEKGEVSPQGTGVGSEPEPSAKETYYFIELKDGTSTYAYFKGSDLVNKGNESVDFVQDYVVSAQKVDYNTHIDNATINWTETGRMSSITDEKGNVYSLEIDTIADDAAYENAYNEYLYQKDLYNKKMDEINAKLEIIQAQDKELELQLRNLDTQENAIATEMDAVKSVTDKNIEKSFNVFG